MKALCGAATALTCMGAMVSLTASPAAAGPDPRTLGPSFVYDDRYAEVLTAVTVRATQRATVVTLEASNFPRSAYGRTFGAHVHVDRCGPHPTDAGKHYQVRDGKGSLQDREVWLDLTVDQQGRALARAERPWAIPAGAANSVVVHSKPTDKGGDAGDPVLCTTVPFAGHRAKTAKEPGKAVEKHVKKDEKSAFRADAKSPEPRAEHHAHDHEGRDHHDHDGRDHEGRDHDWRGHDGRDHDWRGHDHEGRDHHDHDGWDHDGRDHDWRGHDRDHDGRDHDWRDRDHDGRDRDHDGRDRDWRDRDWRGHDHGRDGRDHREHEGREHHEAREHRDGREHRGEGRRQEPQEHREHARDRREGLADQARAHADAQQKQWTKPYQSVLDLVRGQWQGQRLAGG